MAGVIKPLRQEDFRLQIVKDLGSIQHHENSKYYARYAVFRCPICGKGFKAKVYNVKIGRTTRCMTCVSSTIKQTHNLSTTREYQLWNSMLQRCNNPNSKVYHRYGGRGIQVCDDWQKNIHSYIEYIQGLPNAFVTTYSLDRIDNDGNYEPGNLRWATKQVQAENSFRSNGSSKYRGVFFKKTQNRWVAQLISHKKLFYIGSFADEVLAAMAYDSKCIELNLQNKILNKDMYPEDFIRRSIND